MKVECQSCFTDVIPMADRRCPACNALLEDQVGLLTKVTVFQRGPSGGVCMKCGTRTAETVRVRRRARNTNYQPSSGSSVDNHPLALLFNFVAGKYHQSVEVTVPLCAGCKRHGVAEPKYVDFEARSMTFVGHRAWKEDVELERQIKSDP
jgi:hypothetical protein